MILRKPFAILIKYFKLIHAVLTVLSFYLLYRTNMIMSFFSEYMQTYTSVIGKDLTGELYTVLMYVSLFVIIIGLLIIMGLMIFKQKKIKLYIFNILAYICVVVVYAIANSVLSSLEIELVDVRTLKMVQDLLTTVYFIQIVSFFSLAMRATGFDVKKFDFKKDLQELEIEENDNEEFEVNVDLSSDETKRKLNRAMRHAKYVYKENKYVLWLLLGILVAVTCIVLYMNINVYNKVYSKNEAFAVTYFTMSLSEAYSSSVDYKGKEILEDEESLLMIRLKLKNNTSKERGFETARLALKIDEHYFHHEASYDERLIDVGTVYNKQNIASDFTEYLFVFKVPTDFLDEKLTLIYSDYNDKDVKMNVDPIDLDGKKNSKNYNLIETINFEESVLGNIKLKLDAVEIADYFRVDYNYCITVEECYPSYEYIFPNVNTNNRKVLLKINGSFVDNATGGYKNIYSFIRDYGYLEYEINGQTKSIDLTTQLKPTKTIKKDEIYLETTEEVKNAEKVKIVFKVRNKVYKYVIK